MIPFPAKEILKQGVVVHTSHPAVSRLGKEDHEFKACLGYIASPYLNMGEEGRWRIVLSG